MKYSSAGACVYCFPLNSNTRDNYQFLAEHLSLIISDRVVDGDGKFGGDFLLHSIIENIVHFSLGESDPFDGLLFLLQQFHHELVDLDIGLFFAAHVRLQISIDDLQPSPTTARVRFLSLGKV